MVDSNSISLIIPAYNEAYRIQNTLKNYNETLQNNFDKFEIIVVANNCTDATFNIAKNFGGKNTVALNIPYYTGKGGAIIEGFKIAKHKLIGFVDADNSTSPQEFLKLINQLEDFDGCVASRALPESVMPNPQPFIRRIMGKCYSRIVEFLFGLGIKDTQCGAKVFKRVAIKAVLPELGKIKGFSFDVELLWRLKQHRFIVKEVPIQWSNCSDSKVGVFAPFKMFWELIKMRCWRK